MTAGNELVYGAETVFQGRLELGDVIEIPVWTTGGSCESRAMVFQDHYLYVPGALTTRIEVAPLPPSEIAVSSTDCSDVICTVGFSVQRQSAVDRFVRVVGMSADETTWQTVDQNGHPYPVAEPGDLIEVEVEIGRTAAFCARGAAGWELSDFADLVELGDVICADLVDGEYVQRPPTQEELARY